MNLSWTPRARRELDAQLDFIAPDKPSAADRMAELVEKTTDMLRDWPQIGKPGRLIGTLELVIPRTSFIAVYQVAHDKVTIVRLIHGAQKY